MENTSATMWVTYAFGGQAVAQKEKGLALGETFDDGNSTGWTAHAGTWAISNAINVGSSYRQSHSTHTATNSSRALSQSGSMAFEWEVTFESGIAAAGMHLFASEASSTNHGDSYLVWQNATDLMIYKSSGNTLVLQTSTPLSNANGQTHRYKVTYNPTNGQFAVWRDGVSVLNWTDSNTPHNSGSYIALRTNKSMVRFDNIRITGNPATNSTLYHLYGDHLGSTSVLADSSGQVVDKTYYLPFGEYRRGDSSILTESGFTGHLHNDTLGLIYMNARFYSPSSGRFITADTIIPDPTNPQSYNRYSYTYNNPLRFTDPTGHIVCEFQCPAEHILWNAMTGSAWYGPWDVEEQRANTATIESGAKFIGQTLLSIAFEPADWFFSANDAYQAYRQGEYATAAAIGVAAVLPFATGSMGDEVVDAVGRYGDDILEGSGELLYRFNTGRDGFMYYGLKTGEDAASFARAADFKSPAEAFETMMGRPPGSKDVYQVTTVGTVQGSGYYPVYDSLQNGMPFGHVSVYESVDMAGRYMPGVRSYNAFKEMFTSFGPPRPFEFD